MNKVHIRAHDAKHARSIFNCVIRHEVIIADFGHTISGQLLTAEYKPRRRVVEVTSNAISSNSIEMRLRSMAEERGDDELVFLDPLKFPAAEEFVD
jgi:hypothetical protein